MACKGSCYSESVADLHTESRQKGYEEAVIDVLFAATDATRQLAEKFGHHSRFQQVRLIY
jgi:hypothetical protein